MSKKEKIHQEILKCAELYDFVLKNKNYLIVYRSQGNSFSYIECSFLARHFQHLTGIEINTTTIKSSTQFYNLCISKKLKLSDFHLPQNGTYELKLDVLPKLIEMHRKPCMIGDYNQQRIQLQTKKMVGNITAVLGFAKEGNYYVPNTVLQEDIRNITNHPPNKVIAIFSKHNKLVKYDLVLYISKNESLEAIISDEFIFNKISNTICQTD